MCLLPIYFAVLGHQNRSPPWDLNITDGPGGSRGNIKYQIHMLDDNLGEIPSRATSASEDYDRRLPHRIRIKQRRVLDVCSSVHL